MLNKKICDDCNRTGCIIKTFTSVLVGVFNIDMNTTPRIFTKENIFEFLNPPDNCIYKLEQLMENQKNIE